MKNLRNMNSNFKSSL